MLRTCFVNHVRNRGRVSLVRPAKLTVNSLTQETEPTKKLSRGDLFQTYDSDAIVAQELSRGSELVKLDPNRASELKHNKSDAPLKNLDKFGHVVQMKAKKKDIKDRFGEAGRKVLAHNKFVTGQILHKHRESGHDESLVNRQVVLGNGAEIALDKIRFVNNDFVKDQLQYGNQSVVFLNNRGSDQMLKLFTDDWVYLDHKCHERHKMTNKQDRVRNSCTILQDNQANISLPIDPYIPNCVNLERRNKQQLREIFRALDPDDVLDNRNGYGYILSYKSAVNVLRKTATNRIHGCHVFIVKPNISLLSHAILKQLPASLTMIEPALEFRDSLETVAALDVRAKHQADFVEEIETGKKRYDSEKVDLNVLKNSRIYYRSEKVSEFFDAGNDVFGQIFTDPKLENMEESITEFDPENIKPKETGPKSNSSTRIWNGPPPKAQIILSNPGGVNSNHFWRDILPRIADQDGMFKHGRIPISVVMPMLVVNKMTDPDAARPFEDKSYLKNQRNRLSLLLANYLHVENCDTINKKNFHKFHADMSSPVMMVFTPKEEPVSSKMSLFLFESFVESFWENRYTLTFHDLIKSEWMRNEVKKNFQGSYFARYCLNVAGVGLDKPIYEVTPEEFCKTVGIFVHKVPVRNVDYKFLLGLKATRNIKTHVQKRHTRKILDQVKFPVHVREDLENYYKNVVGDFDEDDNTESGTYHLPIESDAFEQAIIQE